MKKIFIGFLVFVILSTSVYVLLPDQIRIDVEKTRTKYSVFEDGSLVLGATEYVNLFDGSKKMRASSRELSQEFDGSLITIKRKSIWKDNIITIQTYTFDSSISDVELVPISNVFECVNCEGKIVHYEFRDILYEGVTRPATSPEVLGHRMKVEWQSGYAWAKLYQQKVASDKLVIRYRPVSDYEVYSVRMFDPPDFQLDACGTISASGSYALNTSVNSSGTCFTITADDIDLDCDRFNISFGADGSSTSAVSATSRDNITVRNCNMRDVNSSGASDVVALSNVDNSFFINNTLFPNGSENSNGFDLQSNSDNNAFTNNTVNSGGSVGFGFFIGSGINGTYTNNTVTGASKDGFSVRTDNNTFTGNLVSNNTADGFDVVAGADNNVFNSNDAIDNTINGLETQSSNNSLDQNFADSNGQNGIVLDGSDNNATNNLLTFNNQNLVYSGSGGIVSNNVLANSSATGFSISGDDGTITNNTVANSTGIGLLPSGAVNNLFRDNVIRDGAGTGVDIRTNANNNTFINNTVRNNAGSGGMILRGTANNTFINNTISSGATIAVDLVTGAESHNFTNNVVSSVSSSALRLSGSSNNTFANNVFSSDTGTAVNVVDSAVNVFDNNTLLTNDTWISIDGTSSDNNISNTNFETGNGIIRIIDKATIPVSTTIDQSNLDITQNDAFLNSTDLPLLNVSSQVTLNNITFSNPVAIADFDDDGTFETCKSPQCVEQSFSNGVFVFNVSSFTTYSTEEALVCGDVNVSTTLNADVNSSGTCFTITADDVVLDCDGFTINFDADGSSTTRGVTATSRNNITVKNCNIRDVNSSGSFGEGIRFSTVDNSFITNNTIQTNGTTNNRGIRTSGLGENVTILNNTIRTFGSSNNNDGMELIGVKFIVSKNSIFTDGALSNVGIVLAVASNFTVANNSIVTNGSSTNNHGFELTAGVFDNTIENNTVSTNPGGDAYGILLTSNVARNTIRFNDIRSGTGSKSEGIRMSGSVTSNVIANNTIIGEGTGTGEIGISLRTNVSFNIIANNTIIGNSTTVNNRGMFFTGNASDNTITGNIIISNGVRDSFGIYLLTDSSRNNFSDNIILSNGTSSNQGVKLESSSDNNLFSNNIINTSGSSSYAIEIINSNNSVFDNTLLSNPVDWINSSFTGITNHNFTNTTFKTLDGSIRIPGVFSLNDSQDISRIKLDITSNNAFLNSTNLSFLNVSSQVALTIFMGNPFPQVDFDDNGVFVDCNPPQCVKESFVQNVLVFNVSSWTAYRGVDRSSKLVFRSGGVASFRNGTARVS